MINQKFIDFMKPYAGQRLAVAVSGGVDSVALLHWLAEWGPCHADAKQRQMDIVALHVNHGLRPAADAEAQYVVELGEKLNVPVHVFHWTGDKPESNLESAARDARYKLMTDWCHKNGFDTLLTAHQADDQIETFFMNLSRGSGVYGLAAMRHEIVRDGVKIVRPLLNVFRDELEKYCDDNNIKYFVDEMNADEKYTRVRIRKNRHLVASKMGITDERILLAIDNLGRTRDALQEQITKHVSRVTKDDYARFQASFLFDVPDDIRLKLLGTLIQQVGGAEYQPRLNSLELALSRLQHDCKITLAHCVLRRLGDDIIIVPVGTSVSFRKRK